MTTHEILRYSPVLVMRYIYDDMVQYAYALAEVPECDLEFLKNFKNPHVEQIISNLRFITEASMRYVEVNEVDLMFLDRQNEIHTYTKTTWDMIMSHAADRPIGYEEILMSYSNRHYAHSIALWNAAYQVLLSEHDVYNSTIGQFIEGFDELINGGLTFGDERTAPLFKLISQTGDFRIRYEAKV